MEVGHLLVQITSLSEPALKCKAALGGQGWSQGPWLLPTTCAGGGATIIRYDIHHSNCNVVLIPSSRGIFLFSDGMSKLLELVL